MKPIFQLWLIRNGGVFGNGHQVFHHLRCLFNAGVRLHEFSQILTWYCHGWQISSAGPNSEIWKWWKGLVLWHNRRIAMWKRQTRQNFFLFSYLTWLLRRALWCSFWSYDWQFIEPPTRLDERTWTVISRGQPCSVSCLTTKIHKTNGLGYGRFNSHLWRRWWFIIIIIIWYFIS